MNILPYVLYEIVEKYKPIGLYSNRKKAIESKALKWIEKPVQYELFIPVKQNIYWLDVQKN